MYFYFEALHTTGDKYIVEGIDIYIEAKQSAMGQFLNWK
ncbi:DUF3791 domain-containing protein [Eisenbergiella porci]